MTILKMWGAHDQRNESSLSSRILSFVPAQSENTEVTRAANHSVKLIMTFPIMLKYHITVDKYCPEIDIHHQTIYAEIVAAKRDATQGVVWKYLTT